MESAFLQAIIENPDDDAPRLIYADWLEERGDSDRAEFIRLQCKYCVITHQTGREMDLLAEHWRTWAEPILRILPHLSLGDIRWFRGFPYSVALRRPTDINHIGDILKKAPIQGFIANLKQLMVTPLVSEADIAQGRSMLKGIKRMIYPQLRHMWIE